jgi:hypothetical protein
MCGVFTDGISLGQVFDHARDSERVKGDIISTICMSCALSSQKKVKTNKLKATFTPFIRFHSTAIKLTRIALLTHITRALNLGYCRSDSDH